MKLLLLIIIIVAIVGFGIWKYYQNLGSGGILINNVIDPKNCTYIVDNKLVTLNQGISQEDIPESVAKITTQYFGNEAVDDFNGDGLKDHALVITQSSGGSGTFYYAVAAMNVNNGECRGTNAILLGDRIAPQNTLFLNGQITFNYADRNLGEPFSTRPSVGVSRYFTVINGSLVEVK